MGKWEKGDFIIGFKSSVQSSQRSIIAFKQQREREREFDTQSAQKNLQYFSV